MATFTLQFKDETKFTQSLKVQSAYEVFQTGRKGKRLVKAHSKVEARWQEEVYQKISSFTLRHHNFSKLFLAVIAGNSTETSIRHVRYSQRHARLPCLIHISQDTTYRGY